MNSSRCEKMLPKTLLEGKNKCGYDIKKKKSMIILKAAKRTMDKIYVWLTRK